MTGYLADTHIALWVWAAPDKLSTAQRDVLSTSDIVYVSIASIWEVAIKASIGKLRAPGLIAETFEADGFRVLPIAPAHAEAIRHLPLHHGDPFDRMLVAQAQTERLSILSSDAALAAYDVRLI